MLGGATRFENCGRDFAKRKQSDVEFAGNGLLRIAIIDIVMNTLLDRVTRHPAGMHCPSWDDAFVSSSLLNLMVKSKWVLVFWLLFQNFAQFHQERLCIMVVQCFIDCDYVM